MSKAQKILFDSSAVLAILKKEPGYKILEEIAASSVMSTVNFGEVVTVLARWGISKDDIEKIVTNLIPETVKLSEEIAMLAGMLVIDAHKLSLSFGDRACIATAIVNNMVVYTTDNAWGKLEIDGLEIVLIR